MQARNGFGFLINKMAIFADALWTIWSESEHLVCARRTNPVQAPVRATSTHCRSSRPLSPRYSSDSFEPSR